MDASKRDMSMVVAMGQAGDYGIEVLLIPLSDPQRFTFRAVDFTSVVFETSYWWASIEEAIGASIRWANGEDIAVKNPTPMAEDWQMLNTLLFGVAPDSYVDDLNKALTMYQLLSDAVPVLEMARQKMIVDFNDLRADLSLVHGPQSSQVSTFMHLEGIAMHCHLISQQLAERDRDTLAAFLGEFLL